MSKKISEETFRVLFDLGWIKERIIKGKIHYKLTTKARMALGIKNGQ